MHRHRTLRRLLVGWRPAAAVGIVALVALLASTTNATPHVAAASQQHTGPRVTHDVHHDLSAPLSTIVGAPTPAGAPHQADAPVRMPAPHNGPHNNLVSPVQTSIGTLAAPATSNNFNGVGNGFSGPQGTFTVSSAPPDTNGAVGAHDYVQTVNSDFAIFNKDTARGAVGTVRYGPVALNTLWSGFGGLCQTDNDGDPTVVYDQIADRWVISQFAVTGANGGTTPYLQCVAVSQTGDPTGAFYRYSFPYSSFNDYPKMSVWPDAYYETYNLFQGGSTFLGAEACAFNRSAMLTGAAATQQCFSAGSAYGGLLPSNVDGSTMPPAGAPNYMMAIDTTTTLAFWKFHVDFTTPGNSTFSGPSSVAVASYAQACAGGTCIPQSGTTQQLDSLADRLMYRLSYRNFGSYESLVVDHSVTAGSSAGMRWYEIRNPASTPSVFQSGTYAPDASYRWMGSIAQDKSGDMAMGFSISSSSLHPGIHYTGRLAADALNSMPQGEASIIDGAGSQSGQSLSRWGDYSAMTVDPVDDCTFWYTSEYLAATGAFNWSTRIGSFKFTSCGGTTTNDFSISSSPSSLSIAQGANGTSTISTAVTAGSAATVSLSASVSPAGPTASLSPTSVTAGGSSTLTVSVGSAVAAGSYTVTVTGTEGTATHSTSVAVTVTPTGGGSGITNGGFETGNLSGWTSTGTTAVSTTSHSGSYSAQVGSTSPSTDSTLAQTFTAPSGATQLSFYYQVTCPDSVTYDWASATLKDNTAGTTATMLANTCTNSGAWVQATSSVTAGHSYTLTLANHDDNYASDPTYTRYDDVVLTTSAPPPTNPILNPGFETGTFSSWTVAGTTSISTTAHSGTRSGQAGSTSPTNGDSSISQTFTAPSGSSKISVYYQVTCPDSVTYDWATITLKDNTAGTTATLLAKTCTNTGAWTAANGTVIAGHSYTLTLTSHDDNYAGDATYTRFDDAVVS